MFEDLHWADQATREAISFLVRTLRDVPIVLLGTYRSDELHRRHPLLPWLAGLDRGGRVERIELVRFDRAHLATLLAAILGSTPRDDLVNDVFDRSDGNPFFAEELLAADQKGAHGPRLPPTLKEILLAHISTVDDPAATVLGVAAVAGRRVSHDLLAQVADLSDGDLQDGLRAAIGATCWSWRPMPTASDTPSDMPWSRRSSTTSCSPASGGSCTAPSRRPSRIGR